MSMFLVPALTALAGEKAWWPGGRRTSDALSDEAAALGDEVTSRP